MQITYFFRNFARICINSKANMSSKIEIKKVSGKVGIKEFVDFRLKLYMNHPHAVPYLYDDEIKTLTPERNNSFAFCDVQLFLAYRDGKAVGRVAGIINRKANASWNRKNVRFGWFDFIDDIEVSTALLDAVTEWGKAQGMTHLVGPLGLTDMDREGMMVEGFEYIANMSASYNEPYYPEHIEKIGGFVKDNDWLQKLIKVPENMPPKFGKTAEIIEKRYNLHTFKPTRDFLMKQGGGQRLFEVLNICYAHLYEYSQLSQEQIDDYLDNYIKMADMNLLTFVVDANEPNTDCPEGRVVGFGVSFPSFSEALQKTKTGKLFPFGWYHLAKILLWHKTDLVDLYLVGVLPEYRQKGAIALVFRDLIQQYQKYGFKYAETLPMMETNDNVQMLWDNLDSKVHKRLRTFKKEI